MSNELLPRHIQVRRQYDRNRFARHLLQPELNTRFRDLLINILTLTPEAKVGLLPINDENNVWMEKFIHVLEEMQIRYGPFPAGLAPGLLRSTPIPEFASALAKKAAAAFRNKGIGQGLCLIKYGERFFLEKLLHEGSIRIQPASYFKSPDLNGAIRDDERRLALSFALSPEDVRKIVLNPQEVSEDTPHQRVDAVLESPSDYWIYCVTESIEPRLFIDFKADACVVIRDRQMFLDRLRSATFAAIPNTVHRSKSVEYVDPLLPRGAEIFLPFAKHFSYSYQAEYRLGWFPVSPVAELEHVDISVGNLEDIAELVTL